MSRRIYFLHCVLGALMLALATRTWMVLGLIEPVTVAGSSMVPALRGDYVVMTCEQCGHKFEVGAEFELVRAECEQCGNSAIHAEGLPVRRADRMVIDRTAFQFRQPRRWEPVVFRSTEDGELTVKRVVGLPGEEISLQHGDVCIAGYIVRKSVEACRDAMRLVSVETDSWNRWTCRSSAWVWRDRAWRFTNTDQAWHALDYHHADGQPITSFESYNAGLSQRLYAVNDLAVTARVNATGQGALRFRMGSETQIFAINAESHMFVEVFGFDGQMIVCIDRKVVGRSRLKPAADMTISIAARGAEITLENLSVYRDRYYASLDEERGIDKPVAPVRLGKNEIFVLGDNVSVSIDSRIWGPVPLELLVGRPLGVH